MSNVSVISLDSGHLEAAVAVLTRSFENYPFFTYILKERQDDYLEKLSGIHRYVCERYLELGLPCFGAFEDDNLVGVLCMNVPEETPPTKESIEKGRAFYAVLGEITSERLGRISKLSKKHTPKTIHCYISMLGVEPEYQGRGAARALLDRAHAVSENHETSEGIFLETTRAKNVDLYRHFGYELTAQDRFDDCLDRWYLYRPNIQRKKQRREY